MDISLLASALEVDIDQILTPENEVDKLQDKDIRRQLETIRSYLTVSRFREVQEMIKIIEPQVHQDHKYYSILLKIKCDYLRYTGDKKAALQLSLKLENSARSSRMGPKLVSLIPLFQLSGSAGN